MKITIQFLGAAQNVTGSCYLVEVLGRKILIDCGMYQEREYRDRNWLPFRFDPSSIYAVLLTHAHTDHCGLLPKLVKEGFSGPIFCTAATADIAEIVLLDSAHIQEEDAEYKRFRHKRDGRTPRHEIRPLYTSDDAEMVFPLFNSVTYGEEVDLAEGITCSFHDAGHILGSSMIRLSIEGKPPRTILFSGDIGRWDKPILEDPTLFESADYVLVESTYGTRVHEEKYDIETTLADVVNRTVEAGGTW